LGEFPLWPCTTRLGRGRLRTGILPTASLKKNTSERSYRAPSYQATTSRSSHHCSRSLKVDTEERRGKKRRGAAEDRRPSYVVGELRLAAAGRASSSVPTREQEEMASTDVRCWHRRSASRPGRGCFDWCSQTQICDCWYVYPPSHLRLSCWSSRVLLPRGVGRCCLHNSTYMHGTLTLARVSSLTPLQIYQAG
jgi:hypothetical protein